MGLFKRILIVHLGFFSFLFGSMDSERGHLLFLLDHNQIGKAFLKYQEISRNEREDFELLGQLCLLLLEQGSKSPDKETQMFAMVGAGLANSSKSTSILEKGLHSSDPQTQLLSLHFLQNIHEDNIDHLLTEAMRSDFLPIRLEAAYLMSEKKHPHASGQIEALMYRLPEELKPFFPVFFSLIGTFEATSILKTLMNDLHPAVRIESIIQAVQMNRNDLLPIIRKRVTHGNIGELEAAAYALGIFKDTSCTKILDTLSHSPHPNVRLAANNALFQLGDLSRSEKISMEAKDLNIFAISALSNIPNSENLLYELCQNSDLQVKTNAAISLLLKRDPRSLSFLIPILLTDQRNMMIQPHYSPGRAFVAWKIVPSSRAETQDPNFDPSLSFAVKEYLLREALELPEQDFLHLADLLFTQKQNRLIPQLIALLENLRTEKTIALLKKHLSCLGSPLIRDYCHLSLFRLGEEGPYSAYVHSWVFEHKKDSLIQLTPTTHLPRLPKVSSFQLTSEERSRLLLEMFTALAEKQNAHTLIDALIYGHDKNRYLLAGLLLKAIE